MSTANANAPLEEMAPLPIVVHWLSSIEPEYGMVLIEHLSSSLDLSASGNTIDGWLGLPPITPDHACRAAITCAAIDFFMRSFGDSSFWQRRMDSNLEMVEVSSVPFFREFANQDIADVTKERENWMTLGAQWKQLRSQLLSDARIFDWDSWCGLP